jgi:multiple sugar transport system substrate-binding protein
MRIGFMIFAAALATAPLGARAADLVVWWEKGFYAQEDEAVREIIAAFEQETGKQVELVRPTQDEGPARAQAAVEAGHPPDFLFGTWTNETEIYKWAYEGRLVDLTEALGPLRDLFDPDVLEVATLLNNRTGRRSLYALPMTWGSNYVHVWRSLLERAGFRLEDIPQEWEAFWSFWCDRVQPAVRQAAGRDDIWGVGLPMSATALDTLDQLTQFQLAYEAPWLGRDGRLQVDDPAVRTGMVKALETYTAIWRQGCTPPDAVDWDNRGNNKAFMAQNVVLTLNHSLSIPGALRTERPDDYHKNAATIDWPLGGNGEPLILVGYIDRAVVFQAGGNRGLAEAFVRFLVAENWLGHWLTFAGDRWLPPMRKLVEQPFWLDTSDPHRMRAAVQILTRPHQMPSFVRDHERRQGRIWQENVWGRAVHRVAADGISPEQAVDEAIARIKEILSE